MNQTREVFQKTDWPLLAKQKEALIALIDVCERLGLLPGTLHGLLLEGLLQWIDAVQDAAEAEGFPVYQGEQGAQP